MFNPNYEMSSMPMFTGLQPTESVKAVEEMLHNTRVFKAGHYDIKFISNTFAKYEDIPNSKTIIIEFKDGNIWKHETSHLCPV